MKKGDERGLASSEGLPPFASKTQQERLRDAKSRHRLLMRLAERESKPKYKGEQRGDSHRPGGLPPLLTFAMQTSSHLRVTLNGPSAHAISNKNGAMLSHGPLLPGLCYCLIRRFRGPEC